ncbi:hypothetical protein NK8_27410 [Caballeronia sp. NK8]|uniref:DUF7946 domain-containing protein n=1 Tax=Caballeronia sp. NK8 TaxID=140098 RepID=UPI001BB658E6|nr:hypothetical protein [Caballeronia sp. NK8]BCQ24567.1 hypothetical protein NK8_27410 [Caballeronia sp. NK8]
MLQAVNTNSEVCLCVLSVRYEGNDAASHEIDLNQLGVSIQGFASVFALCANTLATGRLTLQLDALDVRVVSLPVAEHHCFEVLAMVKSMATSRDLWSGAFGAVLAVVVQYVLSRRDQDQMKFLSEALQGQTKYMNEALHALQSQSKSMNEALQNQSKHMNEALQQSLQHNQQNFETLKALTNKLADALRPAARQALSPIGHSCQRIDLYAEGKQFMTLDSDHKRAFSQNAGTVTEHLEPYVGVISQFDMTTGACRLTLEGATSRIPAIVVDPIFNRPNNRYVKAMTSADPIRFLAKAELDDEGNPIRLYISDTSKPELNEASA